MTAVGMGISHRHVDCGMIEQFLDFPQVRSRSGEAGGKGMTEGVKAGLPDATNPESFLESLIPAVFAAIWFTIALAKDVIGQFGNG